MDVLSWVPEIRKNSNLPTGGVGFLHVGAFFWGGFKKNVTLLKLIGIPTNSKNAKRRPSKRPRLLLGVICGFFSLFLATVTGGFNSMTGSLDGLDFWSEKCPAAHTNLCISIFTYMGVSENNGTPKSSILIGFSMIYHPFWGTSSFGNTHIPFAWIHSAAMGWETKPTNSMKHLTKWQGRNIFLKLRFFQTLWPSYAHRPRLIGQKRMLLSAGAAMMFESGLPCK